MALKPQELDILQITLQHLAQELHLHPLVCELGCEWCLVFGRLAVFIFRDEEVIQKLDAGDQGSCSFGFVDRHVAEIEDVAYELCGDGVDEGANC